MTLREAVAEKDPTAVDDIFEGGVYGCPSLYFHNIGKCPKGMDCDECWSRDAGTGQMKDKYER